MNIWNILEIHFLLRRHSYVGNRQIDVSSDQMLQATIHGWSHLENHIINVHCAGISLMGPAVVEDSLECLNSSASVET